MSTLRYCLILLVVFAPKVFSKDALNILAVHSYHESFLWTEEQYSEFKRTLVKQLPEYQINFSVEYLNAKHLAFNDALAAQFNTYLNQKYQHIAPNLVYVTDDAAASTILGNPPEFLKDTPVVFTGVNNTKFLHSIEYANVTGVFETHDYAANLHLVSQLLPDAKQLLHLGDYSPTDDTVKRHITEFNKNRAFSDVELIHVRGKTLKELFYKINQYPNAALLSGTLGKVRNNKNQLMTANQLINELKTLNRPILMTGKIRPGALAGFQPEIPYGEHAALMSARIIKGESAEQIKPVYFPKKQMVVYWDTLKKQGIKPDQNLFQNAVFLNKPAPFIERHQEVLFWVSIIFCAIALIFILAFVWIIQQRDKIIREQLRDTLTDCANRPKLIQDLQEWVDNSLVLIDINDFSILNSFYGNQIGDRLLQELARLLKATQIDGTNLYRASGDIFAILLPTHFSDYQSNKYVENTIYQLENHVFFKGDLDISITVVAGISSSHGRQRINEATTALNKAKKERKGWSRYRHNSKLQEQQMHNAIWSRKLKSALTSNRMTAFFQPIVHNRSGHISGYEALVRLVDKDGTIISPFHFLNIAKKNRQYPQITKIVIDKSIEIIKERQVNVSINLTLADIDHPETLDYLFNTVRDNQVGEYLMFEITESEGIENHQQINEFSRQIKELGCKLSIDDFGTGYSNFSHLIDLNANHLKIDGSIIQRLLTEPKAELVVATIIEYAKGMGMKTVAEFIDSPELLNKVTEMGIDYSQGYYIGIPDACILEQDNINLPQLTA